MRLRTLLAGLAVVGALLSMPAVAAAEPFDAAAEADYAAALAYWGHGEPANCTSITRELVAEVVAPFGGTVGGAPGAVDAPGAGSPPDWCLIEVKVGLEPCLEKGIIYAEVGDLLGLDEFGTAEHLNAFCEEESAVRDAAEGDLLNARERARLRRIETRLARRELHHVRARCRRNRRPYCRRVLAGIRAELHELRP